MDVRRAAMLFSGGPAPAANAVLNAGVMSLRRAGVEVIGIRDGYTALMRFDGVKLSDDAWFRFEDGHLQGLRNERGVLVVELLENAYSKSLGPELTNYLYKLHSMPAFLANHSLELFSSQTFQQKQ